MNKKILIIEDNEQNMYLLSYLLESFKYDIIKSYNGPDGIAEAVKYHPDMILLDIQLPEMDGYEVVRRLKQIKGFEKLPVIAVSSYAMPGDREKALQAGFDGYFEKPIDTDTFITALQNFFN